MTEYLFVDGPWHGEMREVAGAAPATFVTELELDGPNDEDVNLLTGYTHRKVYLDFDDMRCVREVYVYGNVEPGIRRVFDAIVRSWFRAGKQFPRTDTYPPENGGQP